ncbi:MAG: hypothetical protein AB1400_08750 [Pseudomonadota bacterium]
MANINTYGMARAFPQFKADIDYHLIDLHDGKGVQLLWLHPNEPAPDRAAIEAATAEWQAEQDAVAYRIQRAAEYPPLSDLADALVKKASADPAERASGEAQEAAYIATCQAVKAKYPKP